MGKRTEENNQYIESFKYSDPQLCAFLKDIDVNGICRLYKKVRPWDLVAIIPKENRDLEREKDKFNEIKSGRYLEYVDNEKASLNHISNLYDQDRGLFDFLANRDVRHGIAMGAYSFSYIEDQYYKDPRKCRLFDSHGCVSLIAKGIITAQRLIETYDADKEKIPLLTNHETVKLLSRGLLSLEQFDNFYSHYTQTQEPFVIIEPGVAHLIHMGVITADDAFALQDKGIAPQDLVKVVKEQLFNDAITIKSSITSLARPCGIELEFVYDSQKTSGEELRSMISDEWSTIPDESIKLGFAENSAERASPRLNQPEDLDKVLDMMEKMYDARTYSTESCDLHIHMGVLPSQHNRSQPFDRCNLELIKQTLVNYAHVEEMGLGFASRERQDFKMKFLLDNGFSNRNIAPSSIIDTENLEVLGELIQPRKTGRRNYRDTVPINVYDALYKHGTIEFRAHDGTTNPKDVMAWMKFVHQVVGHAEEMVKKNGKAMLPDDLEKEKLNHMYQELLCHDQRPYGSKASLDIEKIIEQQQQKEPSPTFVETIVKEAIDRGVRSFVEHSSLPGASIGTRVL